MPRLNEATPFDTDTEAVALPPTLTVLAVTDASVTCCVASGLPVDELKPNTLPALVAFTGNVISAPEITSCSANLNDRSISSLVCWWINIFVSKSDSKEAEVN